MEPTKSVGHRLGTRRLGRYAICLVFLPSAERKGHLLELGMEPVKELERPPGQPRPGPLMDRNSGLLQCVFESVDRRSDTSVRATQVAELVSDHCLQFLRGHEVEEWRPDDQVVGGGTEEPPLRPLLHCSVDLVNDYHLVHSLAARSLTNRLEEREDALLQLSC